MDFSYNAPPVTTQKCELRQQQICGNSSVGRARPCQGRGREFESRFSLQFKSIGVKRMLAEKPKKFGALTKRLCSGLQIRLVRFDSGTRLQFFPSPDGGIGRHKGFKIPRRSRCAGSSPAPGTMGKTRIIKAISSVVKPPTGGFFVPSICMPTASVNFPARYTVKNIGSGISASTTVMCYRPARTYAW